MALTQPLSSDVYSEGSVGDRALGDDHKLPKRAKDQDASSGSDVNMTQLVNALDVYKLDRLCAVANWEPRTSGASGYLAGVAAGDDGTGDIVLCAVGESGNRITSDNGGKTWGGSAISANDLKAVAWDGSSLWCAVGNSGTILTASNPAATWTSRTSGTANGLNGVAHDGSGLWVVVGASGTILTSPDGITWTSRTSGTSNALNAVGHGGGVWVVGGGSGTILTSPDGITWTSRSGTAPHSVLGLAYDDTDTWVAVGGSADDEAWSSHDQGVTWTRRHLGTGELMNAVAHDGNGWGAVGNSASVATSLRLP